MPDDFIYLTREGYEKLIEELEYLKSVKRKEIAEEIAKARDYGDLRENAEYSAAKERQAMNEKRIAEIEDTLSKARIIEEEDIVFDEVRVGAKVRLKDLETNEEFTYSLVSPQEANFEENKISISSPIGQRLLGHKKGDCVEIEIAAGKLRYQILDITR